MINLSLPNPDFGELFVVDKLMFVFLLVTDAGTARIPLPFRVDTIVKHKKVEAGHSSKVTPSTVLTDYYRCYSKLKLGAATASTAR